MPSHRDRIGVLTVDELDPATGLTTPRNAFLGWARADPSLYTELQKAAVAGGQPENASPDACVVTWVQHMVLASPGLPALGTTAAEFAQYTEHPITLSVTPTTLEVTRDGVTSGVLTFP